jgi:GNAT superfamily N-acetyltransferase
MEFGSVLETDTSADQEKAIRALFRTCFGDNAPSSWGHENVRHFFLRVGGAVVAAATLEALPRQTAKLWNVCTAPKLRRKGCMTALLRYLLAWCATHRPRRQVQLYVLREPAAAHLHLLRFYEKAGFKARSKPATVKSNTGEKLTCSLMAWKSKVTGKAKPQPKVKAAGAAGAAGAVLPVKRPRSLPAASTRNVQGKAKGRIRLDFELESPT